MAQPVASQQECQQPMQYRTLADLGREQKLNQDAEQSSVTASNTCLQRAKDSGRHGTVLLVASSPSHELDRAQKPNPLLELGGVSLACHSLWQFNTAGFACVVVAIGFQGEAVKRAMTEYVESEKDIFKGLHLKFVDLGKGWRGGRAASIVKAAPVLEKLVKADESFVVSGVDHIFDASLLEEAAATDLAEDGDEACVLVELDLEGMRGLPQSTVYCAMRPLHGADRIYNIGSDIDTYSGIEAGLIVVTKSTMQRLAEMVNANDSKDVRVSTVLAEIAKRGALR
jgi:choline kinase